MRPRLLIIGHAPLLRVNRPAYRHLVQLGWEVRLVVPENCRSFGVQECQTEPQPGLELIQTPFEGASIRRWTLPDIGRHIFSYKPDIVLLDGEPDSRVAFQLAAAARKNSFIFTVLTCENFYYSLAASLLAGELRRAGRDLMLRLFLARSKRNIAHVFTLSRDSCEAMRQRGFEPARTSVIPLGFDENAFHPDTARRDAWREKLGLSGLVVAYFGRLIPEKGAHVLIEALASLKDLPFTFLMDDFQAAGDYQHALRALIKTCGLAECTRFVHIDHEEMPGCLNAVDIVAVPSLVSRYWKEQYGRILPEAMASHCAVVATTSGTLPELLDHHGLLVPPGSSASLAGALRQLLVSETQRLGFAKSGCAHAHAKLSSIAQARLQNDTFRTLLKIQ